MCRLLKFLLVLICFQSKSFGQSPNSKLKEPEVGKPCPEFVLTKIDFYKTNKVSLSDLRGKWVVLDFWGMGCSACISSFSEISRMQKAFGGKVQFIMVGPDQRASDRKIFTNFHQQLDLAMPSAFDNALERSFNVGLLPFTIIIDPGGIVRAITVSPKEEKLRALMRGETPIFSTPNFANDKDSPARYPHTIDKPLLVDGNGGPDSSFTFRSLLLKWKPGNPHYRSNAPSFAYIEKNKKTRYDLTYVGLDNLYRAAYTGNTQIQMKDTALYGTFFSTPIFEINDTGPLKEDYASGENVYCYSLIVPKEKASAKLMMHMMQNDLKNYFGYDVTIEKRRMPYWRLTATKEARDNLVTMGGPQAALQPPDGKQWAEIHIRNMPMLKLLDAIAYCTDITRKGSPLLDETGIQANIDIDLMDFMKGDLPSIRASLKAKGLELTQGEKEMQVIVVRDPKPLSEN